MVSGGTLGNFSFMVDSPWKKTFYLECLRSVKDNTIILDFLKL